MLQSQLYMPTRRETSQQAGRRGETLLLRAGIIRPMGSGARAYLPLGQKILLKIQNAIREAFRSTRLLEVHLPRLISNFDKTGENSQIGGFLQLMADLVKGELNSYRDLPKSFFRFVEKSIDDERVGRVRQSLVAEMAAFCRNDDEALTLRCDLQSVCEEIFRRFGLEDVRRSDNDGTLAFVYPSNRGSISIAVCPECGLCANREIFPLCQESEPPSSDEPLEKIHTPNLRTVEDVAHTIGCSVSDLIKTILFRAGERVVAVLLRGDYDISVRKLSTILGTSVELASAETIEKLTEAPVGFAGPVGLSGVEILGDYSVRTVRAAVTGANEADYHFRGVVLDRDYRVDRWVDVRAAKAGDICGKCGDGGLSVEKAIQLSGSEIPSTTLSENIGLQYTDEDGTIQPIVLQTESLDISSLFDAIVESGTGEKGLVWPVSVAPFDVHVLNLAPQDHEVNEAACSVVSSLEQDGWEVLHDERDVRPGVKFKDAELICLPRIVVVGGRSLREGVVEVGRHGAFERRKVPFADIAAALRDPKTYDI